MQQFREWTSAIASSEHYGIRGYCPELIISSSLEENVLRALGCKISPERSDLFRATIVSHCSHGLTGQSTLATALGATIGNDVFGSILAGFITGAGTRHILALPLAAEELLTCKTLNADGIDSFVEARRKRRQPVYGFGHRFHDVDPRAEKIVELLARYFPDALELATLCAIETSTRRRFRASANIDGAGAAALLVLGVPIEVMSLVNFAGRGPAYVAHYDEIAHMLTHRHGIKLVDLAQGLAASYGPEQIVRSEITRVQPNLLATRDINQQEIIGSFTLEQMLALLFDRYPLSPESSLILRAIIGTYSIHSLGDVDVSVVRLAADHKVDFIFAACGALLAAKSSLSLSSYLDQEDKSAADTQRIRLLDDLAKKSGVRVRERSSSWRTLAIALLESIGIPSRFYEVLPIVGRIGILAAHYIERRNEKHGPFPMVALMHPPAEP